MTGIAFAMVVFTIDNCTYPEQTLSVVIRDTVVSHQVTIMKIKFFFFYFCGANPCCEPVLGHRGTAAVPELPFGETSFCKLAENGQKKLWCAPCVAWL